MRVVPLILLLLLGSVARGQPPTREAPGRWKLETLTLADGTQYRGVVQSQHTGEIEFAEIVQPPGKPMYAVIRGIPRSQAARLETLADDEHAELLARFAAFRHHAVIEAGRMEQVELRSVSGEAQSVYEGPWFRLTSTAADEPTRRCVVRIEQMFRAYRTLLPPRASQPPRLTVALYGSLDDYRDRLRGLELALDNAAFYAARQRTIFAGSELTAFHERLLLLRRQHEEVQAKYAQLDADHVRAMGALRGELKAGGFTDAEATAEIRQRRATFKAQMEQALAANGQRQRTNEQKFAEVTGQMFARLAHEALHAWLDTFVYPHDEHDVPRWLNEGLAQVFETAQLDGDSLRIDAPDRDRLARLKADLAQQPLSLAQLLTAEEREFLGPHGDAQSQRHYLYAWGLAWHLAFHDNLLGSERLDEYVARQQRGADPIARFERLVGQPLDAFERRWHEAVQAAP